MVVVVVTAVVTAVVTVMVTSRWLLICCLRGLFFFFSFFFIYAWVYPHRMMPKMLLKWRFSLNHFCKFYSCNYKLSFVFSLIVFMIVRLIGEKMLT
jgi:hypothetical protein